MDEYKMINDKMVKKTVYAFDYDNTISRDEDGMFAVMDLLEKRGHDVYVVTARRPDTFPDDLDAAVEKGYRVIFTRHISKRKWLEEVEKIKVDVWVDDTPDSIINNWDGAPRTHRDM